MTKKIKQKQICITCLNEFDDNEVYWSLKNNLCYLLYCMKCVNKNDITDYTPYSVKKKK